MIFVWHFLSIFCIFFTRYDILFLFKQSVKTTCIILALCLNIGVDPPDVSKPFKCANLESWVNPDKVPTSQNVCEVIAHKLENNYKQFFPRISIQKSLDPCIEKLSGLFQACRRNYRSGRILVHYNGHGVPAPSENGEIWVFNRDYTQYIPLSFQDVQCYLDCPVMWIFDCNSAGTAIRWYMNFLAQGRKYLLNDTFLLGACKSGEHVPLNPDYPADVFTACLTTPLRMAALWHCRHSSPSAPLDPELAEMIPGDISKRNTPLGELAWIFTTITDTIAYDILPRDLFQRLLRLDITVATLFRNFLLAQRIMRSLGCTPVSVPEIPENYKHPLWQVFDAALESTLTQVAAAHAFDLRYQQRQLMMQQSQMQSSRDGAFQQQGSQNAQLSHPDSQQPQKPSKSIGFPMKKYVPSDFFAEQLQAFDVWLSFGHENSSPPEQLPIVLQVILNQRHRARALKLLSRFADLGPQEIVQIMHVGAIPYLVKLLVSNSDEVREHLVLIWTKILAFDKRYQGDILRERGEKFFYDAFSNYKMPEATRAMAAYVLSTLMDDSSTGQQVCSENHFISTTLGILNHYSKYRQHKQQMQLLLQQQHMQQMQSPMSPAQLQPPQLQQSYPHLSGKFYWWVILAFSKIWENNDVTKYKAIRSNVRKYIPPFLEHKSPEVRAATLYAYGTFFSDVANGYKPEVQKLIKDDEVFFATNAGLGANDGSPLVRKEYVYALSRFISGNIREMSHVIYELERPSPSSSPSPLLSSSLSSSSPVGDGTSSMDGVYGGASTIVPNAAPLPNQGGIIMGLKGFATSSQKPLQEDSGFSFYTYVWKTLLLLADDPQKCVSECAIDLIQRVRRFVVSHVQNGVFTLPQQSYISNGGGYDITAEDPKVALRSSYYEWSCEYWKSPLIGRDFEDKSSPAFKERERKHLRYNKEYNNARESWAEWEQGEKREISLMTSFSTPRDEIPGKMIFHPHDGTLVCATSAENIVVWDWKEQKKVKSFKSKSRFSTKVTSFLLGNEYDNTHLIVASDDGTVKVWKDYASPEKEPEMVTSWVAIPDSRQLDYESKGGSDVVMEWLDDRKIVNIVWIIF